MENVKMAVEGKELVIRVDLTHRGEKSASGKTIRVASTQGNVECPENPTISVGLNVFTK